MDYDLAAKTLTNYELLITLELEVFNSANAWYRYNIKESKQNFVLTCFEYFLNETSSITEVYHGFKKLVKLSKKKKKNFKYKV